MGKIDERMEEAFKQQALEEVRGSIDPGFIDVLRKPAYILRGTEVPDIRPGAAANAKITIRDTQEAKDYQEALQHLIEQDIEAKISEKREAIRPLMSVVQESSLVIQNNPDLLPDTKGFDPDLLSRVVRAVKPYEVKNADGKVIGWHGNIQPIINELRAQVIKERTTTDVKSQQQAQQRAEQQRQQAAAQARTPSGQFTNPDAPQAGITSKSGFSGTDPEADYSTFWNAVGIKNGPQLNI